MFLWITCTRFTHTFFYAHLCEIRVQTNLSLCILWLTYRWYIDTTSFPCIWFQVQHFRDRSLSRNRRFYDWEMTKKKVFPLGSSPCGRNKRQELLDCGKVRNVVVKSISPLRFIKYELWLWSCRNDFVVSLFVYLKLTEGELPLTYSLRATFFELLLLHSLQWRHIFIDIFNILKYSSL